MRKLDLHRFLRVSIGDEKQGVDSSISVLEDLFESIVGAIYIDTERNLRKTRDIVLPLLEFDFELDEYDGKVKISYKNLVQEWCDKYGYEKPMYKTYQTADGFVSTCYVNERNVKGEGRGYNGKTAEKRAAEIVFLQLEDIESSSKPEYKTINDIIFDDNSHEFTVRCILNGKYTEGKGDRVKDAKKESAYNMLDYLGLIK